MCCRREELRFNIHTSHPFSVSPKHLANAHLRENCRLCNPVHRFPFLPISPLSISPLKDVSFLEVTFRTCREGNVLSDCGPSINVNAISSIIYPLSFPFRSSLSLFSAFSFFSVSVGKPLHGFQLFLSLSLSLFFSNTILLNTCRYPPCSLNVAILQSHFQLCFNELCY